MRKIIIASIASLTLFANLVSAATFNLFSPASGVLKGNPSTYVTSAATSTDIRSLWTGTCNSTTFLRADGACAAAGGGTSFGNNWDWTSGTTSIVFHFPTTPGADWLELDDTGATTSMFIGGIDIGEIATNNTLLLFGNNDLKLESATAIHARGNTIDFNDASGGDNATVNVNSFPVCTTDTGCPALFPLRGPDGSAGAPSYSFSGSTTSGLFYDTGFAGPYLKGGNITFAHGTLGQTNFLENGSTYITATAGGTKFGSPTGGFMGLGTINVSGGLYVNGVAVGGSVSGANPTATIGASAVNGVATTYMRSDAAPALPATLPALSGVNLTALNGSNIASGTVAVARGGTGVSTSTGTGNVVLSASPTLTGTVTAATVAATAVTVGGNNVCQSTGTNCPSTAKTAFGKVNGSGTCGISNTGGLTTPCTRNSAGNYSITHSPGLNTNTSCALTADSGSSTITQILYNDNGTTLNVFTFAGGVATDASFGVVCMSL